MTLKIAVPNKGSLAESSALMLKEAGYRQRNDPRDLVFIDPENQVEFYYLRPRDIAVYVGSGELEAGITGRDLLLDSGAPASEVLPLDFGKSTFRFAGPGDKKFTEKDLAGKRIATAYPGLLESFLESKKLKSTIVKLDGAVESSIRLGVADVIADIFDAHQRQEERVIADHRNVAGGGQARRGADHLGLERAGEGRALGERQAAIAELGGCDTGRCRALKLPAEQAGAAG